MAEVPHLKSSLEHQAELLKEQETQVAALQNKLKTLHDTNGALDKEAKRLAYTLQRSHEEQWQMQRALASLRAERQQLLEALERLRHSKAECDARLGSEAGERNLWQARYQEIWAEKAQTAIEAPRVCFGSHVFEE